MSCLHLFGYAVGGIVLLLFIAFVAGWAREAFRWVVFHARYNGRYLLVCTAKRGWHDFLHNNVLPDLAESVIVVWVSPQRHGKIDPAVTFLRDRRATGGTPLLVKVGVFRIRTRSLRDELLALRAHAARDRSIQSAVRKILEDGMRAV